MLINKEIMGTSVKLFRNNSIAILCAFIICISSLHSFADNNALETGQGNDRPGISFNFVDVEIPSVIKFISEITGFNFIFDERIRGKITIIAPTKLSIEESFSLFTSVLSIKGYTVITSGPQTYKIIPSSMAKQAGLIPTDEKITVNEQYIMKLIETKHLDAEDTLQFLRPIVSRDGHISAFGPSNLLLVVDSGINIEKILSILTLIDIPSIEEEVSKINVYFLVHADATDLAKVMGGIVKSLQISYKTARKPKKNGGSQSPPVMSITPDKSTNSLIIVAPPSDYKNIVRVIKTLDKKRKQVYVEAMIVEARIDKLQDLGTKWRVIARNNGDPIAIGGFGNINTGTILNIIGGLTGFSAGGMGNFLEIPVTGVSPDGTVTSQTLTAPGFAAIFSLDEFKGAVNVLSTPQILTSDNEEAEIFVGENAPFISERERDVTTTNTVLNSIERTDVGIKLKITPQITEGDYVKLDIFQEISAVLDASDEVLTTVGPTTTKRATKTSVVVQNGHTVVISGLMQETNEEGVTKIPLLGDIPILGWLFKFKRVKKNKTNLLVFLSPHVVKESPMLEEITGEKHDSFAREQKFYRPGELLVKFREHISAEEAQKIIDKKGASIIKYFEAIKVYHIQLKSGQDVEEAISDFSSLPEVDYAEPDYKFRLTPAPAEPEQKEDKQTMPSTSNNENHGAVQPKSSSVPDRTDKKTRDELDDNRTVDTATANRASEISGTPDIGQPSPVNDFTAAKPAMTENKTHPVEGQTAAHPEPAGTDIEFPDEDFNGIVAILDNPDSDSTDYREYYVQVGSWRNVEYAEEVKEKLSALYPGTFIYEDDTFHKVRIPQVMTEKQGNVISKDLRENFNLNPILVRKIK
jgi:general secretion pathway protein D